MSLALSNTADEFCVFARQFIESMRTSPILNTKEMQRKSKQTAFVDKETQMNELNGIMACIAMFANSMVSKSLSNAMHSNNDTFTNANQRVG